MLKTSLPLAVRFLQASKDQASGPCSKLLGNAALFSTRSGAAAGAEAQEVAAVESKVAQFSVSEAAAMAAKKSYINGLGGLSLQPTRAMSFASSKMFSSAAVAPAAAEAAKESPSFFSRVAKAAAALAAAVAMLLAPPAAADAPVAWQWGFQDMATSQGQAQVDLHHDIMFFVISITILVLYMLFQFATKFHYSAVGPISEKLTHHTTLEVLWTVFPTLIVLLIGIPSLTLIYSMDQQVDKPGLTVKVIGRQWYWSYEMHDHLQHKLVDPDRLVSIAAKTV